MFTFSFFFWKEETKTILEWNAWMLCNASPRNKRKQKPTKTKVTKSRAMKHKYQESQGWSGTQNHTNYLTKCLKLTSIKRFGEDVSILTFSRGILKRHNLSFNKIPNEVISNLYVLSLRVLNMFLRDINSTRIITINNHGILWYPIITQKFFHPKKLWTTTSSSNIVRTYVFHILRTYVMILCNWLILWQNAFYLYLSRFRMSLNTSRNLVSRSSIEVFKSVQEKQVQSAKSLKLDSCIYWA